MRVYTYLILYSYIDYKGVKRDDSAFYYAEKKISDCSLEEAKAATGLMTSDIQKKARKKLYLTEDATVHAVISDIKLIE